jgi:hypothetical protein
VELVARFAQRLVTVLVTECRQATTQIVPFPDEEEVLQQKVALIREGVQQQYATALQEHESFRSVGEQRSVLQTETTTISREVLDRNVEAVKSASYYALRCARDALQHAECVLCALSVWALQVHTTRIADDCFSKFPEAQQFTLQLRAKAVARWLSTDMANEIHTIWLRQMGIGVSTLFFASLIAMWLYSPTPASRRLPSSSSSSSSSSTPHRHAIPR